MADRATVFQGVQIGVELTYGTGVAANKKLLALGIQPGIKTDVKTFRPSGLKFSTIAAQNREWVEAKLSGVPTYTELVYLLSSLIGTATPAQQGSTTAYKWPFAMNSAAADTYKSFTVEQGDATRAHKFTGAIVTGAKLAITNKEVSLEGTMIGKALQDNIVMTATPTSVELVPVLRTQCDVFLAATQAGLAGAAALTKLMYADWGLSDRFGLVWAVATAYATGPAAIIESLPKLAGKIRLEADSNGMALLSNVRTGDTLWQRIKAVGPLIATTYYYTLQIDTAWKVTGVSEFSDEEGVFAIEYELEGVHDATWGKAFQIDLTTTVSAL